MLQAIATKANELARKSSIRFQTRTLNHNAALAMLSKLDSHIPVTLQEWTAHYGNKIPFPTHTSQMRQKLHSLIASQNPSNSLSVKDARTIRLCNARDAIRAYQQLCTEPKLSTPNQPVYFHKFVWGPNYTHPDPARPPYRAVLHDVGYSFTDDTWFKIFETTGITVATGYMFCPTRLVFPEMVDDPTYSLELIPNQPLSDPLAVWCDSNHWKKPTHTVARLTFRGDDGNGYQEDYEAWKSYLTRRVMVPKNDCGYCLLLDIEERQGDYIIYNVSRVFYAFKCPGVSKSRKASTSYVFSTFSTTTNVSLIPSPTRTINAGTFLCLNLNGTKSPSTLKGPTPTVAVFISLSPLPIARPSRFSKATTNRNAGN
jgi:hypothetical protein